MTNENHIGQDVMKAIREGRVHMRPRWHFVLLSALTVLGAFIVLLTLLYISSLGVFLLRDSGAWYATSFGLRGWFSLLHTLPWLLILFIAMFAVILELLVKRYSFVYKKPLLWSVAGIIVVIFAGGLAIAQTPLHRFVLVSARHGMLPPPVMQIYGRTLRQPPPDLYHGEVLATTTSGFILVDEDGAGTTTVLITRETRLPLGEAFEVGERVVVVGDSAATGTVRAFGVREIDEYPED
jgi:hypothetical protein